MKRVSFFACICLALVSEVFCQTTATLYKEEYRPQIHFSPKEHWVNDPNGMVYYKGVYHLFFQYYPGASVWGPMHWGHTTSTDLVHWQEQPVALYPDKLGYIFSGSAVVDKDHTSGFGKEGKVPLVAIYTNHDTSGEKAGRNNFQTQSIAYSLDEGKSWTKYSANPVLKNPGITDFRDPKVMWFEPQKKWVMTLATKDHISFYSSPDLKSWSGESEFGKALGAHGGVWECPDLFALDDNGKKIWVLIININPGAPNGGSGTQYFVGDFDGKTFLPSHKRERWLDYGPDDYAGITWSNTGERKIFLGWMSNWMYANQVPTTKWRNAMTIPRELVVKHVGDSVFIASAPVKELDTLQSEPDMLTSVEIEINDDAASRTKDIQLPCRIQMAFDSVQDFTITLSNNTGEQLLIGYDEQRSEYFIDRNQAGKSDFKKEFAGRHVAPRLSKNSNMNLDLVIDVSSVELFADDGLSVMTALFFPTQPFNKAAIQSRKNITIKEMKYYTLISIWP